MRLFRALLWTIAVAVVLEFTLIKLPMLLLRWRFERLLADFQSTQTKSQGTWNDAQRVMTRWCKWGHYDGTCTAKDCDYLVDVADPLTNWMVGMSEASQERWSRSDLPEVLEWLAWRPGAVSWRFVVQDGRLVFQQFWMQAQEADVRVEFRSSLGYANSSGGVWHVWGEDSQLMNHPDYKAGRPAGCTGCRSAMLTFTPTLSPSERVHLSSFDFSCFTRWRQCTKPADLLPVLTPYRFYEGREAGSASPKVADYAHGCQGVARVLGRDSQKLVEVEVSSITPAMDEGGDPSKLMHGHLLQVLKGHIQEMPGSKIEMEIYRDFYQPVAPQDISAGKRYLVALRSQDDLYQGRLAPEWCGVMDDTPENLQQTRLGISQDVDYRFNHRPEQ